MAQPYLIGKTSNDYNTANSMSLSASGANPIIVWTPNTVPLGYYYTGVGGVTMPDISFGGAIPTMPLVLLAPSDGDTTSSASLLKSPSSFKYLWNYNSFYVYKPVAPVGYIALGVIVTNSGTAPTSIPNLMCVRQDLCERVVLSGSNLLWNNVVYSASAFLSLWCLPNASTLFPVLIGGTTNFPPNISNTRCPNEAMVWDLKQPVF